jgi:hypothetical protein
VSYDLVTTTRGTEIQVRAPGGSGQLEVRLAS